MLHKVHVDEISASTGVYESLCTKGLASSQVEVNPNEYCPSYGVNLIVKLSLILFSQFQHGGKDTLVVEAVGSIAISIGSEKRPSSFRDRASKEFAQDLGGACSITQWISTGCTITVGGGGGRGTNSTGISSGLSSEIGGGGGYRASMSA